MTQTEMVFVLEQTLGHGTHARNLERAADRTPDVGARFVLINHARLATGRQVPVLSNYSIRTAWSARTGVRPLLRKRPADALFVHTQMGALLLGDVMRRIPTVVSMDATPLGYDSIGEHYQHQPQTPALERVKTDINRRSYARASALTTWSDWAADSLVDDYGMPPEKITVVSPGADVSRFRPAADPRRRPGPLRVLFVGGDFHRKGGNDLFAAVRQLPGQVEVDIVTAADPGSAPPGVRVHTGVTHESPLLLELFQGADAFVLPSRAECFGIVYAEAMACGLPVIGCPVGAVAELVVDGHNGLLVPAGQPAALADALRRLAQRPEERQAMGERGLALARRKHDAQRNVEQLIELTQRIASRTSVATYQRVPVHDDARPKPAVAAARKGLALISANISGDVRGEATGGKRPSPDYLRLEETGRVELLDWSRLWVRPSGRGALSSAQHAVAGIARARRSSVLFSDGEHVGIPLALLMLLLARSTPHVMIGHHLDGGAKKRALSLVRRRVDRVIVHSASQAAVLRQQLDLPSQAVAVVPYGVDTDFWSPMEVPEEALVVAAGREHRDYETLARACAELPVRVFITDSSAHSPGSHRRQPIVWPNNVERNPVTFTQLRHLYAAASVVVVPLLPNNFSAGITAALEAMSMGKAVVATRTPGLAEVVDDGVNAVTVEPGDEVQLRAAVAELLADPERRARLGRAARATVLARCSLDGYVTELARQLSSVMAAGAEGNAS